MTTTSKIFSYLLALVIGIFIGSIQKCGDTKFIKGKPYPFVIEKIKWLPSAPVKFEKEEYSPKPTFSKAYISTGDFNKIIDSLRYYEKKYQIDSNSYAVVKDSVYGKKIWSKFEYFHQPYAKIVEREIGTQRTDTLFAEVKKMHLYLTGEAGGNLTRFDYSVGASLVTKKNLIFGYRYGLNTKTHNIGLGIKLF